MAGTIFLTIYLTGFFLAFFLSSYFTLKPVDPDKEEDIFILFLGSIVWFMIILLLMADLMLHFTSKEEKNKAK